MTCDVLMRCVNSNCSMPRVQELYAEDIILSVYSRISYFPYCYIIESPCRVVQGGGNIMPSVYTSYFVYCWPTALARQRTCDH